MNIIVCGLNKGEDKKYSCPICGFESDNIENFAVSMCWNCVYPENFNTAFSNVESFVDGVKDGTT